MVRSALWSCHKPTAQQIAFVFWFRCRRLSRRHICQRHVRHEALSNTVMQTLNIHAQHGSQKLWTRPCRVAWLAGRGLVLRLPKLESWQGRSDPLFSLKAMLAGGLSWISEWSLQLPKRYRIPPYYLGFKINFQWANQHVLAISWYGQDFEDFEGRHCACLLSV